MRSVEANNRDTGSTPSLFATDAQENGVLQVQEISPERLRKFAEGGFLYAILDACDEPAVPSKCKELGEHRAISLFRGTAQESYWAVAPYLVSVDPATLDWITETLWKEPWGIFVLAKADLETLRKHFRHFLVVQLPNDENSYLFRFYDPRALQPFLGACTAQEIVSLFGPINAFGFTRNGMVALTTFRPAPAQEPVC